LEDIYLDNGATTFPKPESVYQAMDYFNREVGGNPGRSGHERGLEAGRAILKAREMVAVLFGISDASRIIFTKNATEALNMAIRCVLKPGGHAVITSLEHNAVWRPLEALAGCDDISYSIVQCEGDGSLNLSQMREALRANTTLIVCIHASNVAGNLLPIADVAEIAAERGIAVLVDAAQTAGRVELRPADLGIQYLAFTGHKELFGPQGTGGLFVSPGADIDPLYYGGTGSLSDSPRQPEFLPDRCESGTANGPGLSGLAAGVEFVLKTGISKIRRHEEELTGRLIEGLLAIKGAAVYGPRDWQRRVGIVSFNLDGFTSPELASRLDERYHISVRPGLHCAPLAHKTMGTLDQGAVRASFSYFNTPEEVDKLLQAMGEIANC
jgi:cysteine desulfurase family protein